MADQDTREPFLKEKNEKFITVSEVTRGIRTFLEHNFSSISILGEISNVRKPGSGHVLFNA